MPQSGRAHIQALAAALPLLDVDRLQTWGRLLANRLPAGGRLLVAGNGGSAAEAQHLSSELVGRFRAERAPLSAIALHADSSSVTAIANDYGAEEVFARQVRAHGRPGDVLLLLSTSGRSSNVLAAVRAARELGLTVWALTGPAPNPLAEASDQAVYVAAEEVATVQECHLVAVHVLCAAIDTHVTGLTAPADEELGGVRRLVVVGDVMLDRDITGISDRLSPEAPVPVVAEAQDIDRPGGAGLAAVLAARDPGWRVTLVCGLGQDIPGARVRGMLREAGVEVIDLAIDGTTPIKTRVRAADRTLLRFDSAADPLRLGPLPDIARARLDEAAAVVVCDYGRGIAAHDELRQVLTKAACRSPLVWDPHPKGAEPVPGTSLAVPNAHEALTLTGGSGPRNLGGDATRGGQLLAAWPVKQVAVTRGRDGAVLVADPDAHPLVVPARPAAGDTCGAGDQLAVTAAMMLGLGRLPSHAVATAVDAATTYVQAGGPAGLHALPPADQPGPLELVARVRARGGKVVGAGGCFDLLHAGHLSLLTQARRLGDILVVCVNSDDSVRRLKGDDRPVVGEHERAAMLKALDSVDDVLVFNEDTPEKVLAELRPDIWVKGGDYAGQRITEADLVESWGGEVVVVPYLDGHSTTSRIDQLSQQAGVR
ncbi:D-glycero-beta-D-manno-heptose 1-phosphate adenylyltransferase [Streptomyces shenzhenensis]|uniref:D-glycero-beta-D-manno-heptose 1-phosphate adenylyltransferase n=1 Tax=Streptomyces shenzhenensis TaxID=943815 RepID=UPI003D8FC1E8